MKSRFFYFLIIFFLMSVTVCFSENEPTLTVAAEPRSATIGDPIHIEITLRHPESYKLISPLQLNLKGISLKKIGGVNSSTKKGIVTVTQVYTAKLFDLGVIEIPSLSIELLSDKNEEVLATSHSISVTINSVLGNRIDEKTDIRNIKGVTGIDPRYERYFKYLYLGGALLLTLLLGYLVDRKLKRDKARSLQFLLSPYEEAFKSLNKLRQSNLLKTKKVKRYYFSLTDIIRRFLERKYGFSTEELTTVELAREVEGLNITDDLKRKITRFFSACELVKFANLSPRSEEIKIDHENGDELIKNCQRETVDPHEKKNLSAT